MGKKKILIVEDEGLLAIQIEDELLRMGHSTTAICASGEKAIDSIKAEKPDLIIMDIKLKGELDGIETAHRIQKQYDIPIIYMTAHSEESTIEHAKVTEPYGYLLKPVNPKELQIAIEVALYKHKMDKEKTQLTAELSIANTTIAKSEKQLKDITSSLAEGIYILDEHANITFMNPESERILGWTMSELTTKNVHEVFHCRKADGSLLPLEECNIHKVLKTGIPFVSRDEVFIRKDGTIFPVSLVSSPVIENGKVLASVTAFRDITERKNVEEALKESEKKYRTLVENIPENIFLKDHNSVYISCNDNYAQDLKISSSEIKGMTDYDFYPEEIAEKYRADDKRIMETGGKESIEEKYLLNGNEYFVHTIKSPIRDGKGNVTGILGVFRDITERKRMEEKLKETSDQIEAVNRELEAFSYSVSHDLRAPLRHASGFVRLLQKRLKDNTDEKTQYYAAMIDEASKRMERLIDDLLAFSRVGRSEINKGKVGFYPLVREVAREVQAGTKGRDIVWEVDELPYVYGDQSLLRLALVNLLSNAVKFTSTSPRAEIRIGYQDERDEFIFFVKDNGVGFDMKQVDRLFGVFQRLHTQEEFEGTGIGLANVQRIISRHGGRTWAEGAVGEGATFYFTLPKTKDI